MTEQDIINRALCILESRLHKPDFYAKNPNDTKNYLKLKFTELEHETFNVMFLDSKHGLISLSEIFRGTIDHAAVPVREIVKDSLKANASAVIFAHNHPSGNCEPSPADKKLTEELIMALNLVDVRVLDHIVVGHETSSFAEQGLITPYL